MFVKKTIKELIGHNKDYGNKIGIEIEVEHENPPNLENIPKWWRVEHDGSLRVNGAEYVLNNPLSPEGACEAVDLIGAFIDKDNKVLDTGRAGVHVHVNVSDLTVTQYINFLCLCHIVEPIIVNWCGDYRIGNLFCLRLKDAEFLTDKICEFLDSEDINRLYTDLIRYSSINLKATPQYGSVEFRAMRSDGNWEDIKIFIEVLSHIKEVARQADNPIQIVGEFSGSEKRAYLEALLGGHADKFEFYEDFERDVYDNVRLIQYYAYSKVW